MKETKFRMWIPDSSLHTKGIMVYRGIYDKNWYLHPKKCILYREIRQTDHKFPLMQFTCTQDKNRNDIYEEDIVHLYKEGWDVFPTLELTGKVIYKNEFASFFITYKDDDLISFIDAEDSENIEIIGNIHENPELLENKQ